MIWSSSVRPAEPCGYKSDRHEYADYYTSLGGEFAGNRVLHRRYWGCDLALRPIWWSNSFASVSNQRFKHVTVADVTVSTLALNSPLPFLQCSWGISVERDRKLYRDAASLVPCTRRHLLRSHRSSEEVYEHAHVVQIDLQFTGSYSSAAEVLDDAIS